MTTESTVDYSKLDPKKLQIIIDKLTEALKLGEHQAMKTRQLRWALTKQIRLNQPVFWLQGNPHQILKLFIEYYREYELVFGKRGPYHSGSMFEDSSCWAMWEKKHWEEAQGIKN